MTDLDELGITVTTTVDWWEFGGAIADTTPRNQAAALTAFAGAIRRGRHNGFTDLIDSFNDESGITRAYVDDVLWLANSLADRIRPEVQEPTA